jgi:hypothetical protein
MSRIEIKRPPDRSNVEANPRRNPTRPVCFFTTLSFFTTKVYYGSHSPWNKSEAPWWINSQSYYASFGVLGPMRPALSARLACMNDGPLVRRLGKVHLELGEIGPVGCIRGDPILVLTGAGTEVAAVKVPDVLLSCFVKEPGFSSRSLSHKTRSLIG